MTLLAKKLNITGEVYVTANRRYDKPLKEGKLECVELDVRDTSAFPYASEEEQDAVFKAALAIPYEDLRNTNHSSVWSTYDTCRSTWLYEEEGELFLKVWVYNGDSRYGDRDDLRFICTFRVTDPTLITGDDIRRVDAEVYSVAEKIRQAQIDLEEREKILAIQAQLLGEVI